MANQIPTNILFKHLYDLEDLKTTTLEELVVSEATKAGFITEEESVINLYRRAWIKKVTEHANHAFKLEQAAEGVPLEETIENVQLLLEARHKKVCDTLELLAQQIIAAVPSFKG
ncbi:hypothetical protein M3924_003247 [Vibrio fluvialis]|nr:hypothetical protein [Vibrio fluvialis]